MSEPMDIRTLRAAALTSEELLARVTAEMQHLHDSGAGMRLEIEPALAFAVVAFVQLALRHPETGAGASAEIARGFVELVRRKFEPHAPAIALAIERGNDPQHDTPRESEPPAESEERQRIIARRVEDLQKRGEPVDRVSLANELMKNGELQAIGGLTYLVTLYESPRQAEPASLIEFLANRETPASPEEILEHLHKQNAAPRPVLTCPYCGHSEPAPFEKVDLYICANCGRTVETE